MLNYYRVRKDKKRERERSHDKEKEKSKKKHKEKERERDRDEKKDSKVKRDYDEEEMNLYDDLDRQFKEEESAAPIQTIITSGENGVKGEDSNLQQVDMDMSDWTQDYTARWAGNFWGEKQGDSVWCSLSRFKLILIFEYC